MICTEQERNALMAAVERYGDARVFSQNAAQHFFRIRAMLAPPDDAVLRERIAKAAYSAWWSYEKSPEPWNRVADAVIAVLRGEATRDDRNV